MSKLKLVWELYSEIITGDWFVKRIKNEFILALLATTCFSVIFFALAIDRYYDPNIDSPKVRSMGTGDPKISGSIFFSLIGVGGCMFFLWIVYKEWEERKLSSTSVKQDRRGGGERL